MLTSAAPDARREGDEAGPAHEGVARSARLVLAWLASVKPDLDAAIDAVALELLCRRFAGAGWPSSRDMLEERLGIQSLDLSAGSLLSGLVGASELKRRQAGLDLADPYLEALRDLSPGLEGSIRILVDIAVGAPLPRAPAEAAGGLPASLFDAGGIDGALSLVEAESCFGLLPVRLGAADAILLEGETIHAFRRRDLGLAFRGMRALLYAGRTASLAFRSAQEALRALQWSDGTFGDYESRPGDTKLLSGRIQLAFQALWTMAEIESDRFRLVRDMLARPAVRQ